MENVKATYATEWDDGETIIKAPCEVNLLTHEIMSIDDKNRHIDSPEEFIIVDDDELFSFKEMDGNAPFCRGRNC